MLRPHHGVPVLFALVAGCAAAPPPTSTTPPAHAPARPSASASGSLSGLPPPTTPSPRVVRLSFVGTNDVHGRIRSLPILGGFLRNLRAAREADGGAVILLDGGDVYQGTLESNLDEGATMTAGYNALGYVAVAVGNHEFDYGPVGGQATSTIDTTSAAPADLRGALIARARQASFRFLTATVVNAGDGARYEPEIFPSRMIHLAAGVRVGIIGVTTSDTPHATHPANFAGLAIAPLAAAVARESAALRAERADLIVVIAHAGANCSVHDRVAQLSECETDEEIFRMLDELPEHTVDLVVAGHTHKAFAVEARGAAVIEAGEYGRAFGRVDVLFDLSARRVVDREIFAPRLMCGVTDRHAPITTCEPGDYEGRPVTPDEDVARVIAPALDSARAIRERELGVTAASEFRTNREAESALGNLFASLVRRSVAGADVGIVNNGGIRTQIAPGPITFGEVYDVFPFDNALVDVRLTGAELERIYAANLADDGGLLSTDGVRIEARCVDGAIDVTLRRPNGRAIRDTDTVLVATTDFVLAGEPSVRPVIDARGPDNGVHRHDELARDAVVGEIERGPRTLDPAAPSLLDPRRPRWILPTPRPVRCRD